MPVTTKDGWEILTRKNAQNLYRTYFKGNNNNSYVVIETNSNNDGRKKYYFVAKQANEHNGFVVIISDTFINSKLTAEKQKSLFLQLKANASDLGYKFNKVPEKYREGLRLTYASSGIFHTSNPLDSETQVSSPPYQPPQQQYQTYQASSPQYQTYQASPPQPQYQTYQASSPQPQYQTYQASPPQPPQRLSSPLYLTCSNKKFSLFLEEFFEYPNASPKAIELAKTYQQENEFCPDVILCSVCNADSLVWNQFYFVGEWRVGNLRVVLVSDRKTGYFNRISNDHTLNLVCDEGKPLINEYSRQSIAQSYSQQPWDDTSEPPPPPPPKKYFATTGDTETFSYKLEQIKAKPIDVKDKKSNKKNQSTEKESSSTDNEDKSGSATKYACAMTSVGNYIAAITKKINPDLNKDKLSEHVKGIYDKLAKSLATYGFIIKGFNTSNGRLDSKFNNCSMRKNPSKLNIAAFKAKHLELSDTKRYTQELIGIITKYTNLIEQMNSDQEKLDKAKFERDLKAADDYAFKFVSSIVKIKNRKGHRAAITFPAVLREVKDVLIELSELANKKLSSINESAEE